nr:DUF1343 domain-containing protein [Phytoactinopolyspora alkaliphila]
MRTRIGAERLCAEPTLLNAERIGLVTNYTGVMPDLRRSIDALVAAGVPVTALFGPEHGLRGTTQAGESEPATSDPESGLPLFDTYQHSGADLDALVSSAGIDALLLDLQDIGTRFYTYIWTMFDLLVSAARLDVPFGVLDRPNPLGGGSVEGPLLDPSFASFVGRTPIPVRHGLTMGELARHLNSAAVPRAAGRPAELTVVTMTGWARHTYFDGTGLPWVMPSVNIPTPDTALAYPGTGLFEGTNLSEGRGTTRPFELIGAPYVDGKWAAALNERGLPGVRFRDVSFTPTFHKYAGEVLRGVQLHVSDRDAFRPVRTAVTMLHTLRLLYPDEFGWRADGPGFSGTHFVDLLWGSSALRDTVDAGEDPEQLLHGTETTYPSWAGDEVLLY